MKRALLASFTLAALTVAAQAENLRYPETGDPAFVIVTPDGWTHTVNSAGNLIVFNEAHTASINFKIGELAGSLDELAAKSASTPDGMPPANKGPGDFGSGYPGTVYQSKLVTSAGVKTDLRMILVKLDDRHFAAGVLLTAEGIKDDQLAAASTVLAGARLTTPPPPPSPPAPPPAAAPAEAAPAPAGSATPATPPTPAPEAAPAPKPDETPPPAKP